MAVGTLQVGRVGMDLVLRDPSGIEENVNVAGARTLTITGQVKGLASRVLAQAMNEALFGQVGMIVPVIWSQDPALTDYYRLITVGISTNRETASIGGQNTFPFNITLQRMKSVMFEPVYTGGLVPNAHSITATVNKGLLGVGVADEVVWMDSPSGSSNSAVLESEDGDIRVFYEIDPADTGPRFSVEPVNYLNGACEVWVDDRLRTGRGEHFALPDPIKLTNGMIELVFNASENGDVNIRHWADAAWETAKRYHFRTIYNNEDGDWTDCRVIRNDPDEVRVQLLRARTTAELGYMAMTVTLKRGWRIALFEFAADATDDYGVERQASEAATALAAGEGIIATSADGDGNKYIILSQDATDTVNLANFAGIELTSAATRIGFGIGSIINSASPDTAGSTADLTDQFFNRIEARVEVTGEYL